MQKLINKKKIEVLIKETDKFRSVDDVVNRQIITEKH